MSGNVSRWSPRPRWARVVLGLLCVLVGGFLTVHPFSSLAVLVLSVVVALVVAGIGELTANDRAA